MKTEIRTIHAFDKDLTYAEYVRICVTANMGTQSVYQKRHLESICKERSIPLSGKETKAEIYDILLESGMQPIDFEQMASQYGAPQRSIGVASRAYQDAFGISYNDVKTLEKDGFLEVTGKYRSRSFGKYTYPSVYSAWQFVTVTDEEIKESLRKGQTSK